MIVHHKVLLPTFNAKTKKIFKNCKTREIIIKHTVNYYSVQVQPVILTFLNLNNKIVEIVFLKYACYNPNKFWDK